MHVLQRFWFCVPSVATLATVPHTLIKQWEVILRTLMRAGGGPCTCFQSSFNEAQNAIITALQSRLSFLEEQMDAMHRVNIVVQSQAPVVILEVIDITGDDDIIDLTDDNDKGLTVETSVEIEEIGGPIEHVQSYLVFTHMSQEELEQVRAIEGSPIPEEDYSRVLAAADWEADMIVRVGIVAPSYECPPPYLHPYE